MSFDSIVLEKGMYSHPTKSFSEVLFGIDITMLFVVLSGSMIRII